MRCTKIFVFLFFYVLNAPGQNPIVAENQLPGTPSSIWDISGAGDLSIQGFATDMSFNRGTIAAFKVDLTGNPSTFSVEIYRLGYYQGNGARLITTFGPFAGVDQPECLEESPIGLVDCGNWAESFTWAIPPTAVSGVYIAKLIRNDNQGASHICFVVRDDASTADMIFKTSDATWQAYNVYGGNSLYTGSVASFPSGHAPKVSYNRPFVVRAGGGGGGAEEDWVFNAAYPMIRFLERNGYDFVYTTDVDMEREAYLFTDDPTPSLKHKIFLSIGHDEYWSQAQRTAVETARDAGMHLAFFSGNEVYWRTRWETAIDGSGTPFRTLVCYKEGTLGENGCGGKCDTSSPEWTGLWRDGCDFPGSGGCNPENTLTGQLSWDGTTGDLTVASDFQNLRFWRNAAEVSGLTPGQSLTLTQGTLGYEWDPYQPAYADFYPEGRVILSETFFNGKLHQTSLYRHSSGALVFGAGTVQWSWGLDENHDRGNAPPSLAMQQATVNILADMDALPSTLMAGLSAPTGIVDTNAPLTTIISPAAGATVPAFTGTAVTGTAADAEGIVAGVEYSIDNGISWELAQGTETWAFNLSPQSEGPLSLLIRSFDDLGNIETAQSLDLTVGPPGEVNCPCTIWNQASVPGNITDPDLASTVLGLKFSSALDGFISGVRFYLGPTNNGPHSGRLWDDTGNLLATVNFPLPNTTGWQEALFASPVPILAGQTYIVSYIAPTGGYSADEGYFSVSGFTNYPLSAFADGENGANGVYAYSSTHVFPSQTFNATNYWVEPVFITEAGPDLTAPQITAVFPPNNSTGVNININTVISFNEELDPLSITDNSIELSSGGLPLSGTVSYDAAAKTLSFAPSAPLAYSTIYTLNLPAGLADASGNIRTEPASTVFTTAAEPLPPPAEGPGGPILVIASTSNPFSRFTAEVLRAQGFNSFTVLESDQVNASVLSNYAVAIIGDFNPQAALVTDLDDWLSNGGTLIAFKPNSQFDTLLGITRAGGSLAEGYLLVNSTEVPGITPEAIQYHGSADLYNLNGATALATLYSDASTPTSNPALTKHEVGTGTAYAFAYDLNKSIVFTRQGNPAWEGQNRDVNAAGSDAVIRANDLFYGDAPGDPQPDWVNLDKAQIPQADEQMHLLSNIIHSSAAMPMPRFWFLPNKHKAAVVMTGDDHAGDLSDDFFDAFIALSPASCSLSDWECVRSSSYLYVNTPLSPAAALNYQSQGFEVGIHINTGCNVWTTASLEADYTNQLAQFATAFPGIAPPISHRTHCIAWSDYDTQPLVMADKGIRLDANYYYWPESWIQDRPGLFTGSGVPMRFATAEGELIDVYQVATQMTDESGQTITTHINTLLDNALGEEQYFGAFCMNMHTDRPGSIALATTIVNAAQSRGVPVISSQQLLTWLDAKQGSNFNNISFSANTLSFDLSVATGADNIYAMLPLENRGGELLSLSLGGNAVTYTQDTIKGVGYVFFEALPGTYAASYGVDMEAPLISDLLALPAASGTQATISWTTSENADAAVFYGTDPANLDLSISSGALALNHQLVLLNLIPGTEYFYKVSSTDGADNVATEPIAPATASFTTPIPPSLCLENSPADFSGSFDATINNVGIGLSPILSNDFDAALPYADWGIFPWTGGTATVNGGSLTVDGARFNSITSQTFGPGSSLEAVVVFGAAAFQHVGFGGGSDATDPGGIYAGSNAAAMFSTANNTTQLFARTSVDGVVYTDVSLGAQFIGSSHLYRIDWLADGTLQFFIDGALVHTSVAAITETMRPAISDFNAGGPALLVDRISLTPFNLSGTFTSDSYDAGTSRLWQELSYTADVPLDTEIELSVRVGESLPLQGDFLPVAQAEVIDLVGRYIQYRAELSSTDGAETPVLTAVQIACADPDFEPVLITVQPTDVEICPGDDAVFTAEATGFPLPQIKWQSSTNGIDFTDLADAVGTTLTLGSAAQVEGALYRGLFLNGLGDEVFTDTVIINLKQIPQGVLIAVDADLCPGELPLLKYQNTLGDTEPLNLKINGELITGILPDTEFALSESPLEESIWTINPSPAVINDEGQTLVTGVKFRSQASGTISSIRFYKSWTEGAPETFIGSLYTDGTAASPGILLGQGSISYGDSDFGWVEIPLDTPVEIESNTVYIAAYTTPNGNYSASGGYFNAGGYTEGGSLSAVGASESPNGVFVYRTGSGISAAYPFPSYTFNNANYWVDVVFAEAEEIITEYTLTEISGVNGCINQLETPQAVNFIYRPLPTGILAAPVEPSCENLPVNLGFSPLTGTGPFSLTINGETYSDVGSAVQVPGAEALSFSLWNDATVPTGNTVASDGAPLELGMKFRTDVPGFITGVRFYRGEGNAGPHQGSLWSAGGTLLATGTFPEGSTAGWQTLVFETSVAIEANTTYLVSYTTPDLFAIATGFFENNAVVNGPLRGLAANEDGSNGVFASGIGFPTIGTTSNYWVDPVFQPGQVYNLTAIEDAYCVSGTSVSLNLQLADDAQAPIPDLLVLPDVSGTGTVEITLFPTATDNCSGSLIGTSPQLIFYEVGEYTITWTYTDASGNTATQQQNVVVGEVISIGIEVNFLLPLCGTKSVYVALYEAGTSELKAEINAHLDGSGGLIMEDIDPGLYDVYLKAQGFLGVVLEDKNIQDGDATVIVPQLKAGDLDGNNNVGSIDLAAFISAFNKTLGQPGFNPIADFDCSQSVGAIDLSSLIPNFNTQGYQALPITP